LFGLFFETGSYDAAQAALELMLLSLHSAGNTGMYHQAGLGLHYSVKLIVSLKRVTCDYKIKQKESVCDYSLKSAKGWQLPK
jgi:hypothetical protein